ncbi:MAG: heme-binding domain-containing protein [Pseudobdellovibrionaceae bacterium]|nr:MAG: heme-binding domain-containing protein [Pseudobdellovibrionaceae bacterium]
MRISKQNLYIAFAMSCFVHLSAYAHKGEDHSKPKEAQNSSVASEKLLEEINEGYISKIKPILKTKCLDCHGSNNHMPWYHSLPGVKQIMNHDIEEAKEHMDMTKGFPFAGHGTPKEDLEALRETLKEDSMPPWQYKLMHWDSGLTSEEMKIVNQWINESLNKLNNGGNR